MQHLARRALLPPTLLPPTLLPLACVALGAATVALLLARTSGCAIHEGDEAIYAQMAREMAASANLRDLTWQRDVFFQRPPAAVWLLASGQWLFADERAVRVPLALVCGAQVALTARLGTRWFGPAGLLAGALLATADLFVGYGRFFESEPLLTLFVVAAVLAWERARTDRAGALLFGLSLGGALLTKQIIGLLPLLAPLAEFLGRRDDRGPRAPRSLATGACVALAVALPWHLSSWVAHGFPWFRGLFLANVVGRATQAVHSRTDALFYVRELLHSERAPFVAVYAAALVAASLRARGDRVARTLALWGLGPLLVFSVARSRHDHYLLPSYPAFALATAGALGAWLPARRALRASAAAALVVASIALHLPRNIVRVPGEVELRALVRQVNARVAPPAALLLFDSAPFAARYYATLDTYVLAEAHSRRVLEAMRGVGVPTPILPGDVPEALRGLRRPFVLIAPRAFAPRLRRLPLRVAGGSPRWAVLLPAAPPP